MKCTRKEFAELAGCSTANLTTYIGRKKVFLMKDGKTIDTNRRENADFLEGRKQKGLTIKAPTLNKQSKKSTENKPPTSNISLTKIQKAAEKTNLKRYEVELAKLNAELEKKLVDTELQRQKLATLLGDNISIKMVKSVVSQLSKSILNNYESFSKQQINEICHQHRIKDEDRAKLVSKNTTGLNGIHKKAITDARTQLKNEIGAAKLEEIEQAEEK
jgi:hypothetical protein